MQEELARYDKRVYTDRVILEMTRSCSKSFEELEQEIKRATHESTAGAKASITNGSENNDLSDKAW